MRDFLAAHPTIKRIAIGFVIAAVLIGAWFVGSTVARAEEQLAEDLHYQWIPLVSRPGDEDYPRHQDPSQCDPNNAQQQCGLGNFFVDCGTIYCGTLRVDSINPSNCLGPVYVDVNNSRIRQIGEDGWASIADIQNRWGYSFIDGAEVTDLGLKVHFSSQAAQRYLIPRPQSSPDYPSRFHIVAICSLTAAQAAQ